MTWFLSRGFFDRSDGSGGGKAGDISNQKGNGELEIGRRYEMMTNLTGAVYIRGLGVGGCGFFDAKCGREMLGD